MQKLILFFIITSSLFSANIDKSLYKSWDLKSVYEKIQKDIDKDFRLKHKSKKILELEKATIKKLINLNQKSSQTTELKTINLSKKVVSQKSYLNNFFKLIKIKNHIKKLDDKLKNNQELLFNLKSKIQKSISNQKDPKLLSNQLLYAFYKISNKKIKKSIQNEQNIFEKSFENIYNAIDRVYFEDKKSKIILNKQKKEISNINNRDKILKLDKDTQIIQQIDKKTDISKKEKILQQHKNLTLIKKIKANSAIALKNLQKNREKDFITTLQQIKDDINSLTNYKKDSYLNVLDILSKMQKKRFDKSAVAIADTDVGLNLIKKEIKDIYNKTLFVYEDKAFSLKSLLDFTLILFVGFIIARIYKKLVDSFRRTNRIKSLSLARMMANSGYYLIILASFLTALFYIGLNLHTIFIIIGAILLWVAFGIQNFLSNYALGILLKIDRSIKIGDLIEIENEIIGQVDDMNFRTTTILTGDNVRVTIPNSRFVNSHFINHSLEDEIRRLHIPFSANKRVSFTKIKDTILDELKNSKLDYINTTDRKPKIIITQINRKIVKYSLLIWINRHDGYDLPIEKSKFFELIHRSLKKIAL